MATTHDETPHEAWTAAELDRQLRAKLDEIAALAEQAIDAAAEGIASAELFELQNIAHIECQMDMDSPADSLAWGAVNGIEEITRCRTALDAAVRSAKDGLRANWRMYR